MKRKQQHEETSVDTSKPTAIYKAKKGRSHTVSIAVPGSIIANAQTHDIKTALAGQIARALCVFCVDEIVIFDDGYAPTARSASFGEKQQYAERDRETGYTAFSDPSNFLYHVLSYLETPPHLRRALFPHHPNLRTAGSLPSLDMPHHSKPSDTDCLYREGVTIETMPSASVQSHPNKKIKFNESQQTPLTYANIGATAPVKISNLPGQVPPNMRITLELPPGYIEDLNAGKDVEATPVAPEAPREEQGYYWGYSIRVADSLSAVFEECPYENGYDYSVGTSERGIPVQRFLYGMRLANKLQERMAFDKANGLGGEQSDQTGSGQESSDGDEEKDNGEQESGFTYDAVPKFSHLLVAFGGVAGLEQALRHDTKLRQSGVREVQHVFDAWINLVEDQGSRTIRTEEAVWIGLMGLKELIDANARKH